MDNFPNLSLIFVLCPLVVLSAVNVTVDVNDLCLIYFDINRVSC